MQTANLGLILVLIGLCVQRIIVAERSTPVDGTGRDHCEKCLAILMIPLTMLLQRF